MVRVPRVRVRVKVRQDRSSVRVSCLGIVLSRLGIILSCVVVSRLWLEKERAIIYIWKGNQANGKGCG